MRILVADDDPEMLEMVTNIVTRELHAEVTKAHTGHELLERIAHADFDLVITDISMPWMTGLHVMHSVRTAGLPIPVVVMTALRDAHLPDQVELLGDRAYLLRKPFSYQDLLAAIDAVEPAA
jgi:CheY-like chemotaxis protein